MPFGPIDPREGPRVEAGPLAPPYPDLAIAAGRRTVPYLRALKRLSKGTTFTVFLKDPYGSREILRPHCRARTRLSARRQCHRRAHASQSALGSGAGGGPDEARCADRRPAAPARRPAHRRPEHASSLWREGSGGTCRNCGPCGARGNGLDGHAVAPHAFSRAQCHPRWRAEKRLRLGRSRRQSLSRHPRPCRCGDRDRRQRQHGGRGGCDRQAGLCLRTLGRASQDYRLSRPARKLWARCGAGGASSKTGATRRSIPPPRSPRKSRVDIASSKLKMQTRRSFRRRRRKADPASQ